MPEFKLLKTQGRLYDPVLCRFLSPDPYVQAPENSQSYNRYSYCLNNPMVYSDPSGNSWTSSEGGNNYYTNDSNDIARMFNFLMGVGTSRFSITTIQGFINFEMETGGTSSFYTYSEDGPSGGKVNNCMFFAGITVNSYGGGFFTKDKDSFQRVVTQLNMVMDSFCGKGSIVKTSEKDLVDIPKLILLSDGRQIAVTFKFTSSDSKNGNQPIRGRLLYVLKLALLKVSDINSIDISATTNGNHKDSRHKKGLAMDIDMFNGISVRDMNDSQMIIDFQKSLETSPFLYQDFGPSYNFYPGHNSHVHFSINPY